MVLSPTPIYNDCPTPAREKSMSTPFQFVFYVAVKPEKLWEGLFYRIDRIIFAGADFKADMKPGGSMKWIGPGPDGKPTTLVQGQVLRSEPPKSLQYTFQLGQSPFKSRVTAELEPETEATKLTIRHDQWQEGDPAYAFCSDGWPRILSRFKTLLETAKPSNRTDRPRTLARLLAALSPAHCWTLNPGPTPPKSTP